MREIGPSREISQSFDSSIQVALDWLERCTKGKAERHDKCSSPSLTSLPTRVIAVGKTDADIRLHMPGRDEKALYVALSHCWGGKSGLTLTGAKLDGYVEKGIPAQQLPKTFLDAIAVTRRLGIPYIWIDSLCIIQDSKDDWEKEGALMADVYGDAFVSIASHAAPNSSTGFLDPPARIVQPSITVPFDLNGKRYMVQAREGGGDTAAGLPWHSVDMSAWANGSYTSFLQSPQAQSKLSTRGWVYQESLLAPRTLTFAATEVAFECRTRTHCECAYHPTDLNGTIKGTLAALDWCAVVAAFSAKELTFETDRLPALAGIAAALQRAQFGQDQYLCGVWRSRLKQHLLWSANTPSDGKRVASTVVPTWSWASVRGAVSWTNAQYNGPDDADRFCVLDVDCRPSTNNPYGPAADAYIQVAARVVRVEVTTEESDQRGAAVRRIVPFGSHGVTPGNARIRAYLDQTEAGMGLDLGSPETKVFFCLFTRAGHGEPPYGLLLKEAEGGKGDFFERIGMATGNDRANAARESDWSGWVGVSTMRQLTLV